MNKTKLLTLIYQWVKGLIQNEIECIETKKKKIELGRIKKELELDKKYDAILQLQISNSINAVNKSQEQDAKKVSLEQIIS